MTLRIDWRVLLLALVIVLAWLARDCPRPPAHARTWQPTAAVKGGKHPEPHDSDSPALAG